MASINYATREISCKIVYYGPGLSGKTTNLQIIHRKIPDKDKSEMVSLATETDRTLFFDFLPLDLGSIKGFSTKFQLYTVPGQVYYNATRKLVLRGVDGVVFVVDSQVDKLQENLESFANLQENLREYGHSIENIPLVLQYNKRDLPNVYPVDQLNALINKFKLPHYEAVAATGVGVFTTLKGIGKSVIDKFNAKYAGFQGTRRPARAGDVPPAGSVPAPQPKAPAPPSRPASGAPQPFPGSFGGPSGPQPFGQRQSDPGFRSPLNVPAPQPQGPAGGFNAPNPFGGNTGFQAPAGFPGAAQAAPSQPAPISGPAPSGGFGTSNNPFGGAGAPPAFGAQNVPGAAPAKPTLPSPFASPGAPAGGMGNNLPGMGTPSAFPFAGPKPGFPDTKPAGQSGPPQGLGNSGFNPPAGGIPISPFVESFATAPKPSFPGNPPGGGPNLAPPSAPNPFGAPPAMSPFGQNKPAPMGSPGSMGNQLTGAGFPPGPQPMPGGRLPGGFGGPAGGGFPGQPGGYPSAPSQPGPAFMPTPPGMPGAFGGQGGASSPGSPYAQNKGQGPFPTLTNPSAPAFPNQQGVQAPPSGFPGNPGAPVDNSGIVTTYEDMAKDDSFKTKKIPHPNEKKKGFFDGLFKKEK